MTLHTPLWMQPSGADPDITPTAQEFRQLVAGLMWGTGQGIFGQATANTGYQVVQRGAGANFSVDIGAGVAAVLGDDVTGQGYYTVWNDGTVNLATPAAPGSGTRVHRLVLQVRDKLHNGTYSTYDCIPLIVQDTGGGTPGEPNSALTLAYISIAAGQLSVQNVNITDKRLLLADPLHSFAYTSGWSTIAGATAGYRLMPGLRNYLELNVQCLNSGSGGQTIATLPAGYRISGAHRNSVFQNTGATAVEIYTDSTGVVQIPAAASNSGSYYGHYIIPLDL